MEGTSSLVRIDERNARLLMQLALESNREALEEGTIEEGYWRRADCADEVTGLLLSFEPVAEGAGGAAPAIDEPKPNC